MDIEIFGAVSERSIREMTLEVEGRPLETRVGRLPTDLWVVTALLERTLLGRFDIVFRFPDLGLEHGIELKQISFISLPPMLRGKVAFEEAARALRTLDGMAVKERHIAVLFGAAIRDFAQWLDLPDRERWLAKDPACRTAGDIFAAMALPMPWRGSARSTYRLPFGRCGGSMNPSSPRLAHSTRWCSKPHGIWSRY